MVVSNSITRSLLLVGILTGITAYHQFQEGSNDRQQAG
jgi:hypothetical protein